MVEGARPHLAKHRSQTGEAARSLSKPAPAAPIRHPPVRNRLPARIFTVDIPSRRRKIQPSGFPTQRAPSSRYCAGKKKTCLGEKMNKADLVDKIAGACEISKAQANTAIDTAMDSVTAALRKGDRVALIGFGTFSVSQRKARNGRNPQTGATIKIAARK